MTMNGAAQACVTRRHVILAVWALGWLAAVGWAAGAAAGTGGIRVATEPDGVKVYVDGTLRGESPLVVEGLAEGTHEVQLEHKGRRGEAFSIRVRDRVTTELDLLAPVADRFTRPKRDPLTTGMAIATPAMLGVAWGAYRKGTANRAPDAGTITASYQPPAPAPILADLTVGSFMVEGFSDPDGDSLGISWQWLRSGAVGSPRIVASEGCCAREVIFPESGQWTVVAMVKDRDGEQASAVAQVDVLVGDIIGTWQGNIGSRGSITLRIQQNQTRADVTWADTYCKTQTTNVTAGASLVSPGRILAVVHDVKSCEGHGGSTVTVDCALSSDLRRCEGQAGVSNVGMFPIVLSH